MHDLHRAGGGPPVSDSSVDFCATDAARFDDVLVQTTGPYLRVVDLSRAIDRDPLTEIDSASDVYATPLPAGTRALEVEAAGNSLVAVESRADGTYLEVFDARKVQDGRADTFFDATTDSRGRFKVTAHKGSPHLAVRHGRALVTLGSTFTGGDGLYLVDLRPLMDDDDASTMGASSLQGFEAMLYAGEGVVRGHHAYVASQSRLRVFDIGAAMDEDPATIASGTEIASTLIPGYAESLELYGSYLMATGYGQVALVDISSPISPITISSVTLDPGTSTSCWMGPGTIGSIFPRQGVTWRGTRAYVTTPDTLRVFELE